MWSNSTSFGRGYRFGNDRVAHRTSGVHMSKQLGDGDGRAIDLVLDRGSTDASDQAAFIPPSGDGFENRVRKVESILRLLSFMPAPDPSPDLVMRTLERVAQFKAGIPHASGVRPPLPQHGQTRHPA